MADEMYDKKVTIRELVDFFKFERLTGDDESLKRYTIPASEESCISTIFEACNILGIQACIESMAFGS